ncbi:metalloregulator ArsR/SmtB family transcription factor [Roseibacterium sp. SDUM158016]|uniref:ArsR/SmtB family transcription factor n=1 Tax=Roseicyclus sediminis TaxID=2980997 RepID=UPI0021D13AB9|nr:metalloregulator ArsR/SmtB family transcription factor [Roseibacterium sp. SDUM158016]MCU4654921.1 metalloregulator ArsR/SmtB family transcription factor [Roseibacterium sp. SDUM158016]
MTKHDPKLDVLFSALSDPTRRTVLERLCRGPASVGELAAPHDMALPSFLGHLRKLEAAGLVTSDKKGRVRTVRLVPGALQTAHGWLTRQNADWPGRMERLDSFVSLMKRGKDSA